MEGFNLIEEVMVLERCCSCGKIFKPLEYMYKRYEDSGYECEECFYYDPCDQDFDEDTFF